MQVFPIRNVGRFTITGATNANPIVVTTSALHQMATGETVTIAGVQGNTNTNGTAMTVTVLSTTTFSLDGIKGNGDYTAGGYADTIDALDRYYPAHTALTGTTYFFPNALQTSKFDFYIDSTQDGSAGGQEVDISVYGRVHANTGWFRIGNLDHASGGWFQWVVGGRWSNRSLDLKLFPYMYIEVHSEGGSGNTVSAWISV